MAITIIKAEDRLKAKPKINIAIFGTSGSGKTTQARTLDPKKTLFVDLEAGTLAIQDWAGDVLDVRKVAIELNVHPWEVAKAIAVWIGGPDPADTDGSYSAASYANICAAFGDPASPEKYDTVFVDSITVASRMAFQWSQKQPAAFSEKTGKPDNRGAYGLLGQEMIRWITHLQHASKSIIVVGILDSTKDDLNRWTHAPQIEGGKTGRELPGIFDQVLTLASMKTPTGEDYRAFICWQQNDWGFPAKDRSGRLNMVEPPDLGALIHKIHTGKRIDQKVITTIPATTAA